MRSALVSFFAGLVFAIGLGIAGMTKADKVIGFLEVAGDWDPSLALVMVGAIGTHAILRRFILGRSGPVFGGHFRLPKRHDIDGSLVGGAALFGIGWAIGGYCPGPGIVSVAGGSIDAVVFVATMTAAMVTWQAIQAQAVREAQLDYRAPGLSPRDTTPAS